MTRHLITVLAALVVVGGVAQGLSAQAPPVTVNIRNFAFDPQTLRIAPGTTVQWVNRDGAPHQILMLDNKPGTSSVLSQGEEHRLTFRDAGRFPYECGIHGRSMSGEVIVQAP